MTWSVFSDNESMLIPVLAHLNVAYAAGWSLPSYLIFIRHILTFSKIYELETPSISLVKVLMSRYKVQPIFER